MKKVYCYLKAGRGRPDGQDAKEIPAFAKKVLEKLESGSDSPVKVPGNCPYKNGMSVTMTPVSHPSCNQCGKCAAVCPAGAGGNCAVSSACYFYQPGFT
ncbi:MAG: hypothetical protein K2O16_03745 [Lachnospiraceae bacterium]|nr:hypothetical protein [Lachnospiraceae bacterium]